MKKNPCQHQENYFFTNWKKISYIFRTRDFQPPPRPRHILFLFSPQLYNTQYPTIYYIATCLLLHIDDVVCLLLDVKGHAELGGEGREGREGTGGEQH